MNPGCTSLPRPLSLGSVFSPKAIQVHWASESAVRLRCPLGDWTLVRTAPLSSLQLLW